MPQKRAKTHLKRSRIEKKWGGGCGVDVVHTKLLIPSQLCTKTHLRASVILKISRGLYPRTPRAGGGKAPSRTHPLGGGDEMGRGVHALANLKVGRSAK